MLGGIWGQEKGMTEDEMAGWHHRNIMASDLIASYQINGKTVETVADFIFLGSKITAYGD